MYIPKTNALRVDAKTAEAVIFLIFEGEETTRNRIAKRLGISAMTVGKVVRFLLNAGWIEEREGEAERGRTPARLTPSGTVLYANALFDGQTVTLLVASATEELTRVSLPYNPALSPEGNLEVLRGVGERLFAPWIEKEYCLGVGAILRGNAEQTYAWRFLTDNDRIGWDCIDSEAQWRLRELAKPSYRRSVCHVAFDQSFCSACFADGVLLSQSECPEGEELREEQTREWIRSFCEMRRIFEPDWVIAEGQGRYAEEAEDFLAELNRQLPSGHTMRLWHPKTQSLAERAVRTELNRRYAHEIVKRAHEAARSETK